MGSAEKICKSTSTSEIRPKRYRREATYSCFHDLSRLELLLRVFETDVGVVHRPNDTIDVSGDIEEHCSIVESLDGSLRKCKSR